MQAWGFPTLAALTSGSSQEQRERDLGHTSLLLLRSTALGFNDWLYSIGSLLPEDWYDVVDFHFGMVCRSPSQLLIELLGLHLPLCSIGTFLEVRSMRLPSSTSPLLRLDPTGN